MADSASPSPAAAAASAASTITPATLAELLAKQHESLLESLVVRLQSSPELLAALAAKAGLAAAPSAASAPPAKKRGKKAAAPSADSVPASAEAAAEKPKRAPNVFATFCQRVRPLVRQVEEAEAAVASAEDPAPAPLTAPEMLKFCGWLKDQKGYDGWADEDIQSSLPDWRPLRSEESKQSKAGLNKKKPSGPVGAAAAATAAALPALAGGALAASAAPAKKTAAIRPKKPAAAAGGGAAAAEPVDLRFRSWSHEGSDYYKNGRGDVISAEMEWVGRWDGSAIQDAPEPEDLATAEFADEE